MASLRPCTVDELRAWLQEPALAEFFRRLPPAWTLSEATLARLTETFFVLRVEDEPIGLFALTNFDQTARRVELGVGVLQRRRLQAVVDGVHQALDYIFNGLGYHKVICQFLATRRDIRLVLGAYGFQLEARLRESCYWQGAWHDEIIMSLLDREFSEHGCKSCYAYSHRRDNLGGGQSTAT